MYINIFKEYFVFLVFSKQQVKYEGEENQEIINNLKKKTLNQKYFEEKERECQEKRREKEEKEKG